MLNVNGFVDDPEILAARAAARRSSTSIPASGRCGASWACTTRSRATDAYVTVGERIGRPDCAIPTCGLDWITTPQPVVLDEWPVAAAGAGEPLHERRELARAVRAGRVRGRDLRAARARVPPLRRAAPPVEPRRSSSRSTSTRPSRATSSCCATNGWPLADPARGRTRPLGLPGLRPGLEGRADGRQEHVRAAAQRLVQRSQHLLPGQRQARSSPRTRASPSCYPAGAGLLAFDDPDEALRRPSEAIAGDYARHCAAARELAEEHFDSDRVCGGCWRSLGYADSA